jgi:tRNA A-37 threonylcarbamoyl transferase component Bud32
MAFVEINARYQKTLEQWGLTRFEQFQELPALVVSGHPERHVAQVVLGDGPGAIRAYLKRQHRVAYSERLRNAWAGFGLASKSYREYLVLQALRNANIGCPDPIAAGEDGQGRAFVVVREVTGTLDLRLFLGDRLAEKPPERRRFLRLLGETLARIHDAGFTHPDLYAKHVLVDPESGLLRFLDWQRSRRRRHVTWRERWRDLAALHATLADPLATTPERIACLCTYLRASVQVPVPRSFLMEAIQEIDRRARRLRHRRRIREQRQVPVEVGTQNLIWLKGEALCVTREFREEMQGKIPEWLDQPEQAFPRRNQLRRSEVYLPGPRKAHLVHRWVNRPLRWLWACLRRRRLTSPEVEQAGTLFRLQRFGVATPRLLAVGERHPLPWRTESFLLTEPPAEAISLAGWLARQASRPLWTAERKQRRRLLREAGQLLHRMHEAGYQGTQFTDRHFLIRSAGTDTIRPRLSVVLGTIEGIRSHRHRHSAWRNHDFVVLRTTFAPLLGSRTDQLRFFLGYLGQQCLTPAGKRLLQKIQALRGNGDEEKKPPPPSFSLVSLPPLGPGKKRVAS